MTRKLAREVFHGMTVYRGKMQLKQAFLFRLVDVANELFGIAASAARAEALRAAGSPDAGAAAELADLACRNSRRRVRVLFHALWHNDDALKYRQGVRTATGDHSWLEEGALGLPDWPEAEAPVEAAAQAEQAVRATVA
jgi:hypothetical protein